MLYLHIPFCKQACSYCNFHFSTSLKNRGRVIDSLVRELRVRREELPEGSVPTIYFGGGTPSLLTAEELDRLFLAIREHGYWQGEAGTEITLEANPDDLDAATVATLVDSPVNRLSIGIQSFEEADLKFMNRAHNAVEARAAVEAVRRAGFENLSIDLIYGGQTTTDRMWENNLEVAIGLGVNHVAAYALTVEPNTALGYRVANHLVPDTSDERFARHFSLLTDRLTEAGFEQYEISNFARPGHRSQHNSGYWTGQPYLGVGPGAHSFDGANRRRWTVSNNARYARVWADLHDHEGFLAAGPLLFEEEYLSATERYNEFIMTGLRRSEGIDLSVLTDRFGVEMARYFQQEMQGHLTARLVQTENGCYRLTREGKAVADGIIADGFR